MRILIDECVDPRVQSLFPDYQVSTVHEMGWGATKDRELLHLAQEQFNIFLTIDRGLEFQQNLSGLELGIIIARVPKNQLACYRALLPQLISAIESAQPGALIRVDYPRAKPEMP